MNRKTISTLCLSLVVTLTSAQNTPTLPQLYRQLEEAIAHSAERTAAKGQHIATLRQRLDHADTYQQRYQWADSLFAIYHNYQNDSAIHYARQAIGYARQAQRPDLETRSTIALAHQCAETGLYDDAKEYLSRVNRQHLDGATLPAYYAAQCKLHGELGVAVNDPLLQQRNFEREHLYRDSLLALVDTTSLLYFQERVNVLCKERNYAQAAAVCDSWARRQPPLTPDYALVAYFRSEVCKGLGDREGQKRWLALSAISDVSCAITNQASLWSLAELLNEEGDLERSYEYIDYSWVCATFFNAHLRHWQVSPVMTAIDQGYKEEQRLKTRNLLLLTLFVSLTAIVLLALIIHIRRKHRQLSVARNELARLNAQLNNKNEELQEANLLLQDSNRVKDEYIGNFLSLCSNYIDKLDNYRIKVNRKLKANQTADLKRMTDSEQLKEDELRELFVNFDTVFLHLFPNFLAEFNQLLRPEEQITLPQPGQMTPELRIFALIRLGINESSRIAEFLHFSPNTVYAYRTRIKNKALGPRDAFERQVKEIGIFRA